MNCVPLRLVAAQREDLLELIDDPHDARALRPIRQRECRGEVQRPWIRGHAVERVVHAARPVKLDELCRELRQRVGARREDADRPVVAAGQDAVAAAPASSPARTSDDLPLPDGPSTARNRVAFSCSTSRWISGSRPK